eukprot:3522158-Amphidinium_carterae.1
MTASLSASTFLLPAAFTSPVVRSPSSCCSSAAFTSVARSTLLSCLYYPLSELCIGTHRSDDTRSTLSSVVSRLLTTCFSRMTPRAPRCETEFLQLHVAPDVDMSR